MICARCGGYVERKGPLSNLTHTECANCGGINCQQVDDDQQDYTVDDERLAELEAEMRADAFGEKGGW